MIPLGFSEEFIPVDTEAIRPEDVQLAATWAKEQPLDAIVSTDGDADRPLTSDEHGRWLRGDVTGILSARFYAADSVATPVSCNGALELCKEFEEIERTQIGSPFVIAGMQRLQAKGCKAVVGYEANGGFLHQTPLRVPKGGILDALPTRDAVAVHLAILVGAKQRGIPISELVKGLPARFTASDRDQSFATERSKALLERLGSCSLTELAQVLSTGPIEATNQLDGLRIFFASGEVVHLRPSGNAPELRCYSEGNSEERAEELVAWGLERARALSPA